MAGDQSARGRHADEDRADPLADGGARLLAQGGVRLVADDDRVRVRDLAGVADEPLVRLDRHGPAGRRFAEPVLQQRPGDALAVAAVTQLSEELIDQVAAVREDQNSAGARGLDEAEGGNRLAGARGVLEPEATMGARVVHEGVRGRFLLGLLGRIPVERLLVDQLVALDLDLAGGQLLERGPSVAAARHLDLRGEGDQRAGERVDLVGREDGPIRQMRLLLAQQPLEAEHQRVPAPPVDRGLAATRRDLRQRVLDRGAPRRARRERGLGRLAFEHERLARKLLSALQILAGDRRGIDRGGSLSHVRTFSLGEGRAELRPTNQRGVSGVRPSVPTALTVPRAANTPSPWGRTACT